MDIASKSLKVSKKFPSAISTSWIEVFENEASFREKSIVKSLKNVLRVKLYFQKLKSQQNCDIFHQWGAEGSDREHIR